jgi:hypothetical protein
MKTQKPWTGVRGFNLSMPIGDIRTTGAIPILSDSVDVAESIHCGFGAGI